MGSLRHEGVALNANGAGIAADPTLTDTWSCPKAGTWHPMFSLPVRPKTFLPVLSPALAPASGSTLHSIRSDCAVIRRSLRLPHPTVLQRAVPQPGFPLLASASSGCSAHPVRRPSCSASSASDRVSPTRRRTTTRFRHRPALRLTEVFNMRVSRFARTGSATSSRFRISQVFQIVRSSGLEDFRAVPMS